MDGFMFFPNIDLWNYFFLFLFFFALFFFGLVAGNYYSLKGMHEKAVVYFLKALRLDRRCLSAWTLMGHEFIELKNSGAAIESYRQAVGE